MNYLLISSVLFASTVTPVLPTPFTCKPPSVNAISTDDLLNTPTQIRSVGNVSNGTRNSIAPPTIASSLTIRSIVTDSGGSRAQPYNDFPSRSTVISTPAYDSLATSSSQRASQVNSSSNLASGTIAADKYDLYISRSGSDGYDGTSAKTPVLTIRRLQQLALSVGNGVRIKFLESSLYSEELDLSSLKDGLVDAGFSVLDASNMVAKGAALWSRPDPASLPNVWQVTVITTLVNESYPFTANGRMPSFVSSTSLVNSTRNSYYVAPDDLANGSPVTIYTNSLDDPNINSITYRYGRRFTGLRAGNGFQIKNLTTQTSTDNNGSLELWENATISNVVAAFGHKHNVFFSSGTVTDLIAWDGQGHPYGPQPVVLFTPMPTGKTATLTRCHVLSNEIRSGAAFYGHGNDPLRYANITVSGSIVQNFISFGVPSTDVYNVENSHGKVLYGPGAQYSAIVNVNRSTFSVLPGDGPLFAISGIYSLANVASWSPQSGYRGVIELYSGLSQLTIDKCTFAGLPKELMKLVSSSGATKVSVTRMVSGVPNGPHVVIKDADTYTGNYNVFFQNQYGEVKNIKGNTTYKTLAEWQAATGQDKQSVYVTTMQQSEFWVGDPSQGNFHISPNAQVTDANGVVYTGVFPDGAPISYSGVQEHYDHTTRNVLGCPPVRWPVPPASYEQSIEYIKDPTLWKF